jgi:hypothetical protein
VVVALDPWLPMVDLLLSWPDPSPGRWARCEAARAAGVGASLGGHGASASPSSLLLSGSSGGHGVAVEVGACAVGFGGVAGGEVGGRQGAGGGLEGQVASAAPPYPLLLFGGGLGVCGGGRQGVWSAAGGSGSLHGRRQHGGRWNTVAAAVHVFGGGGATHGRCWLVERFMEAAACGRVWVATWEALVPRQSPLSPPSFLAPPR